MEENGPSARLVRFGTFEVDVRSGELRKSGLKLKLSGQPFQVLAILLERPGEVVTREQLQKRLWPDTFVDVDHNLNTAINKIREALGDSAETPRFVETLPRRGYRFIGSLNGTAPQANFDVIDNPGKSPRKRTSTVLVAIAGAAVVLLIGVPWFLYHRAPAPALPKQRALTRLTFDQGLQVSPTWSPDGRYIAYTSDRGGKFNIWVQQVSGGDAVRITKGLDHHWQPDWSPDGKYIAFRSEEGKGGIYVIPPLGGDGQERKIASFGYHPRWSPDGTKLLFQTHFGGINATNKFYVVGLDGSPPREVVAKFVAKFVDEHKSQPATAVWHPDGQRISLFMWSRQPSPNIWTVPLEGGAATQSEISPEVERQFAEVAKAGTLAEHHGEVSLRWSPRGDALYFESGYRGATNVWKMTIDPKSLRAIAIDRLTTGPGPDGDVSISPDGQRLAFSSKSERIGNWLFGFDAAAGRIIDGGRSISAPGRLAIVPSMSPDGRKVVFSVSVNGVWELWEASADDGRETPLIVDGYDRRYAQWSPDGSQLAYSKFKPGTTEGQINVWSQVSRDERPITAFTNTDTLVYDWSPDGKTLLVTREGDDGKSGVWQIPLAAAPHAENAAKKIAANPAYYLWQPHYSPSGRWIVFQAVSNEETAVRSTLYVIPTEGGMWKKITDGSGWDDKPRWSVDGKTVYYVSGRGAFFNVCGIRFDDRSGEALGKPFRVSDFDKPSFTIPRWIPVVALSVAQNRLLVTMQESTGNVWILDDVNR